MRLVLVALTGVVAAGACASSLPSGGDRSSAGAQDGAGARHDGALDRESVHDGGTDLLDAVGDSPGGAPDSARAPDAVLSWDSGGEVVAPEGGAGRIDLAPAVDPLEGVGRLELISEGHQFVEGARWNPTAGKLLFGDYAADVIYTLTPPRQIERWRSVTRPVNIDLDPQGRVVVVEQGRITRTLTDGRIVDVVTDYRGMDALRANDLAIKSDGTIFVSDTGTQRLMRIDPKGALHVALSADQMMAGNGLALSADERTLYIGGGPGIRALDVERPDRPTNLRLFAAVDGKPDGLCVDTAGNVFIGAREGVRAFDRAGRSWGGIALPGGTTAPRVTKCAFAESDARTMYIMAVSKVYRVRVQIPGVP